MQTATTFTRQEKKRSDMKFAVLLMLLFSGSLAKADDLFYRFRHFTATGNFNGQVCGNIVQDKSGFIWIPTYDGLYRFDGYTYKKYEHRISDPASLSFNTVSCLFADDDGTIWAGTFGGGLNHLDPATGKCIIYRNKNLPGSLPGDRVSCIYSGRSGKLWIATAGSGLSIFDRGSGQFHRIAMGSEQADANEISNRNNIFGMLEDRDGDLLVTTWDGLYIRDHLTGKMSVFRCDPDFKRERNNCMGPLCQDSSGTIWIGTWGGGLKEFDKASKKFTTHLWNKAAGISPTNNICQGVIPKSADELWIAIVDCKGYAPLGIMNTRSRSFSFVSRHEEDAASVPVVSASGLYSDRDNNIWISFGRNGLSRLDLHHQCLPFESVRLSSFPNLPSPAVSALWKDAKNGKLVIGTKWSNEIVVQDLKKNSFYTYVFPAGDQQNISAVYVTRNGKILVGGEKLWEADTVHHQLKAVKPPPPGPVYAMAEDGNGNLWCTSSGSTMYIFQRNGSWTSLPVIPTAPGIPLHGLTKDTKGRMWTGSDEHGLFVIDPATFKILNFSKTTDPDKIRFDTFISFHEDRSGRMWCGGIGGIAVSENNGGTEVFRTIANEEGLSNTFVSGIQSDTAGNMWALTLSGISRIRFSDLSVTNFETTSARFIKRLVTSFYITGDNEFFLGSEGGYTHFYPSDLFQSTPPPAVAITSFKVFDREYPLPANGKNPLSLTYDQNYFSFEFAALNFDDAGRNRYAYMLEGLDQNWIMSGDRRYVSYTNLTGGNYIFRVKASGEDGTWSESGVALPLHIGTAWWKTGWFYLAVTLLSILMVVSIYSYRLRQIKAIHSIRNRLAADLHDEVGSSLSNIRLLSEMLPLNNTHIGSFHEQRIVDQIRENSKSTLEGMYDIIWNLHATDDKLENLLGRLKEQTVVLTETKNIHLEWDIKDLDPGTRLSVEKRRDLYLASREGIQNALKHSGCSMLSLKVSTRRQTVTVDISDNGKGISAQHTDGGNGLTGMKQRMDKWKGHCVIASSGTGTSVRLTLPV